MTLLVIDNEEILFEISKEYKRVPLISYPFIYFPFRI